MKSERSFWVTAAFSYTLAWGWWIFFANTYFWDDWASFFGKTAQEPFDLGYYEEKHFLNPFINPILLEFGVWMFRLLIFVLMFGAGVFVYKIVSRLNVFTKFQCQLFTLVFLLLPVNHARFSIQTFEYSMANFFFFLGWYLLATRRLSLRLPALLCFLVAIGTPSYLTFMLLPLVHLFYQDRPRLAVRPLLAWTLRQIDVILLVLLFAVFFKTSQGEVEKYGITKYGLFYSFFFLIVFGTISFLLIRRRKRKSISNRRLYMICGGVALVWLATVPYWIIGYDPVRGLPDFFQLHAGARIQAREFFTLSMSLIKLTGGFIGGFALLYLIKSKSKYSSVLIPNIFVLLYLVNNHFVGPMEWDSRLQLLWPLGLALIAIGLMEFVPDRFSLRNSIGLVCILTLATSWISAEYLVDSMKQKYLIAEIKKDVQDLGNRNVLVSEYKNRLNARDRTYRVGEWSGIVNSSLFGDDNIAATFIALKDDQSCPVSYRAVALYPRVKSSFIESLLKRRVDVEIGRIDLPVKGFGPSIKACPER